MVINDEINGDGGICKARGLNSGLKHVNIGDWLIFTDADTLFTPNLINYIQNTPDLEEHCLYGINRKIIQNSDDLEKYLVDDDQSYALDEPKDALTDKKYVLGYFQLFKYQGQHCSELYQHAGNEDIELSKLWKPQFRRKLPGFVLHLGQAYTNWVHCRTPKFETKPNVIQWLNNNYKKEKHAMPEQSDLTTKVNAVKIELYDIIERQSVLNVEAQKLEQLKQNKLKELGTFRQQLEENKKAKAKAD